MYLVAVSMDGKELLATVSAGGVGYTPIYPQPSVLAYIQSDGQGMWGRNCPVCQKYFRTTHVMSDTFCPYCSEPASSLDFVSKDQRNYLIAFYGAFARALIGRKNTSLDMADITDQTPAWHYSEEKQQFHFTCDTPDCHTQTDILGNYGYCPRCGRTNARKLFSERVDKMLARITETKRAVSDRRERSTVWEKMVVDTISDFEYLAKHLRRKLLCFPMTENRKKELENVNFQKPLRASESLKQWFDVSMLEWPGSATTPKRQVAESELPFIKMMIQKRHILVHNGGIVDQEYLDLSGDTSVRLDEHIDISSRDTKRFIDDVRQMATNLLDNVENGFIER
jgi:endogenous inhibitor of DNA gyrase (YacG/DUF329 family)